MKGKSKIIALVVFAYVASYALFSVRGNYQPIAYGVYRVNGKAVVASKKFGQTWQPGFPEAGSTIMEFFYFPLICMDKVLFHRKKPE